MAPVYDHKKIEKKWQDIWLASGAFAADDTSNKQKLYVLDMFPYPSGSGLHVGHVEGYTATDIYSRFKRMQGFNVLHPMGWDAFGLPAENYAIKTGIPPAKTTNDAINTFRSQIKALGLSYDWSREIGAHNPDYYKWTQWFFLLLYKNGLAYKKKALVNWDPVDQTVLANEQVLPDGTAERSGAKVEQKELEQWFFKITDYADALVDDLDQVDWPESTKINQRNWIGRSEGALITFPLKNSVSKLDVFTTRPDTIFGATYMVVAPEHPWLAEALSKTKSAIENAEEVRKYIEKAKQKTDLERQEEAKEKTGVELKGVKAINPANHEEIPIFVADYVLGSYGTGAIMAVPAHDERDGAFAKKFNLPVRQVVAPHFVDASNPPRPDKKNVPRVVVQGIVRNPKDNMVLQVIWKQQPWKTFVIGGAEEGEDLVEAVKREVREETGYKNFATVERVGVEMRSEWFANHKDENRFARMHVFELVLANEDRDELSTQEQEKHSLEWVAFKDIPMVFGPVGEMPLIWPALNDLKRGTIYTGDGILINSGKYSETESQEAKKKITEAVGGKWMKTYRLRDWLISRQRYWGAPIPVVYDPEGAPHPIPEEHLPWLLPTDVEFKPKGTSPLGQSKELLERTEKIFGKGWRPEIDTMDTFVCSSWYYYRFADPKNEKEFATKEKIKKWLPVDLYVGGAEHTVLHLMYARFFTKVLQKMGYVNFGEPFLKLRHQGTILAEDGSKMSKSKGNVINPDEIVERYGADSVRLYEMFMGPLEAMKPWNTKNIMGVRRFLDRVWRLEVSASGGGEVAMDAAIQKITEDMEKMKFNTAISALMIVLNQFEDIGSAPRASYENFLRLLTPLAPHIAHELAEKHGIDISTWPSYDATKITSADVTVPIQINGKVRASLIISKNTGQTEALTAARELPEVKKWLALGKEMKAVYVPGKVISFQTEQV